MLRYDQYWQAMPLNAVPKDIISAYTGDAACQGIFSSRTGDRIMIHFRYSSHLWALSRIKEVWDKEIMKVDSDAEKRLRQYMKGELSA